MEDKKTKRVRVVSDRWFVRVDGNAEWLETKLKELSLQIDVEELLGYYHEGAKKENPHAHYVIKIRGEIQDQTMGLRIKKHFGITKEKSREWSCKQWDGVKDGGCVGYMFHEPNVKQLVNKGWSEDELAKAKLQNESVQKVVEANKARASNKLVDKAVEHFAKEDYTPSNTDILYYMLKEIKKGEHYHPGNYRLKGFVEEVSLKLTHDNNMWELAQTLADSFWR